MKEYWSARIRGIDPYVPGEQPKGGSWIKLNTNECPYPPSPKVIDAIRAAAGDDLRLYPDPECTALRQAIAIRYGLSPEQVFCANGSDEALAFAFQAFFDPDKPVVFPRITYSFYPVYSDFFGLHRREPPMGSDFSDPVDALCGDNGGVVLANPNAPTGIAVGLDVVEKLLQANPDVVVVVDEAYVDFGADSAVELISRYRNLLVIQTASKSRALAGMRVGWAMGNANLIHALCCVRDSINSYTVDRLAQVGAIAAIGDDAWFQENRRRVIATRERTAMALKELGFTVLPSKANFLFVRHPDRGGRDLLDALRERGILVRWWSRPEIRDWLRISIGSDADMDALLKALGDLI